MSLFTANGSRGICCDLGEGPVVVVLRSVICTSAETFFVSTLHFKSASMSPVERSGKLTEDSAWPLCQRPGQAYI